MKKLMFLTMMFGLMIAFSISVSAQNKGNGKVVKVNDNTGANSSEFLVKIGDEVVTGITEGTGGEFPKGRKYTRIEVRQTNKIVYIYYSADTGDLQDQINNKKTKITGVCTNSKPLKAGDALTIQTQPANGGGTDVTFSFGAKACFSFIAK